MVSRIHQDIQRSALTVGKTFTEEVAEVLEQRTPNTKAPLTTKLIPNR